MKRSSAKPIPEWALRLKKPNVEIRWIGKGLYAYQKESVWIPELKASRKKTVRYLGKVTPEGIQPQRRGLTQVPSIFEHGNIRVLDEVLEPAKALVREHFGSDADTILATAVLRTAYTSPIKRLEFHQESSTVRKFYPDADVEKNAMTAILRRVGRMGQAQMNVYRGLAQDLDHAAIDMTQVASESRNIPLLEKGYNAHGGYPDQVQLLLVHAVGGNDPRPAFLKLLPGSIRDAPTLKNAVFESGIKRVTLVGDKGWISSDNIDFLDREKLGYVLALKRGHPRLHYVSPRGYHDEFTWRKRIVWVREAKWGKRRIYQFLDKALAAEEETTFLHRVHEGKKTRKDFEAKRLRFGTLAVVTNQKLSPQETYALYKQRGEVELAFDAFKNVLDCDKSYMQNQDALRGYYFIAFLSLYAYAGILNRLRAKDILDKYSVEDVLRYTAKIQKISDGTIERDSEVPKKVRELVQKLEPGT